MSDLTCAINDLDNFSSSLLIQYIDQMPGLALTENREKEAHIDIDILFVDADQVELNSFIEINPKSQIVIVSSNEKYIHALFKEHVAGYLSKSELTYSRFTEAMNKIKLKILS